MKDGSYWWSTLRITCLVVIRDGKVDQRSAPILRRLYGQHWVHLNRWGDSLGGQKWKALRWRSARADIDQDWVGPGGAFRTGE